MPDDRPGRPPRATGLRAPDGPGLLRASGGTGPGAGGGTEVGAPDGAAGAPASSEEPAQAADAPPTRSRVRAARVLAVAADALQIFLFPLFGEGFASPVNDLLDMGVALALVRLVGFHWVFLPSIVAEAVPGLDLAPTWTAAVLFATAGSGGPARTRAGKALRIALALLAVALGAAALLLWQRR